MDPPLLNTGISTLALQANVRSTCELIIDGDYVKPLCSSNTKRGISAIKVRISADMRLRAFLVIDTVDTAKLPA